MFKLSQISQLSLHVTVFLLAVSWLLSYLSPLELILDQCWYQYVDPSPKSQWIWFQSTSLVVYKDISIEKMFVSLRYRDEHSIGQRCCGNVCNVCLHWRFGYRKYSLLLEHTREVDYDFARKPVIKWQTGSLAYTYLIYHGTHTFMLQCIYIYIYMYASTWVRTHKRTHGCTYVCMTPSYAMPDSPFYSWRPKEWYRMWPGKYLPFDQFCTANLPFSYNVIYLISQQLAKIIFVLHIHGSDIYIYMYIILQINVSTQACV